MANKNENIDEIIRFYEKTKIRAEYLKQNDEICGNIMLSTPPQLSQIRRVKFQPTLSPIAQSPLSEDVSKSSPKIQKEMKDVQTQTDYLDLGMVSKVCENRIEIKSKEDSKDETEKQYEMDEIKSIHTQEIFVKYDKSQENQSISLLESQNKNSKVETQEKDNQIKKYSLRENSRSITYTVPSLRVKLRRDTEKPEYNPFKTHNYFKPRKNLN
ncbi:uncharacterized protein cubi_02215 [Cryptosporidium ubiquitum]|uniref:Uncharacterized protein n=1 Tax=Cryptosporidium ubiquitum TaxID=857276 RepID=A0A1J4MFH8_9CRYT|nr:uncharacterized protein cubi_02215 [Cryptosporidium ubiquitum]OII72984.1 hypothetical protein cubi_02215 [Cryptosporidium ubiquitum]